MDQQQSGDREPGERASSEVVRLSYICHSSRRESSAKKASHEHKSTLVSASIES